MYLSYLKSLYLGDQPHVELQVGQMVPYLKSRKVAFIHFKHGIKTNLTFRCSRKMKYRREFVPSVIIASLDTCFKVGGWRKGFYQETSTVSGVLYVFISSITPITKTLFIIHFRYNNIFPLVFQANIELICVWRNYMIFLVLEYQVLWLLFTVKQPIFTDRRETLHGPGDVVLVAMVTERGLKSLGGKVRIFQYGRQERSMIGLHKSLKLVKKGNSPNQRYISMGCHWGSNIRDLFQGYLMLDTCSYQGLSVWHFEWSNCICCLDSVN